LHPESWGKCTPKHEERQTAKHTPDFPISFASTPFNHSAWRITAQCIFKASQRANSAPRQRALFKE
jgi:hypothetical protein